MNNDIRKDRMVKIKAKKIWWTIVISYIVFSYSMLKFMPMIWNKLNTFLGGKGVILQYIIYSIAGMCIFLYIILIKKERLWIKYFLFFLFIGIFFLMVKFQKNPGEKIHMAQYGLLGILLYNALKISFDRFGPKLYFYGSGISIVAGAFDEVIQGILPNRCFTWHDVFINGASGVLALLVIRMNILRKDKVGV